MYMQSMYNVSMRYEWDPEKNEWLKQERNISFEQIIFHLSQGDVWRISAHPDQDIYSGQRLYFVVVENYIYIVPHIIEKEYIFLKTIIPSRKATKIYLEEKEESE
jgi:uncharacterized DUF497 family protein